MKLINKLSNKINYEIGEYGGEKKTIQNQRFLCLFACYLVSLTCREFA